MPDLQLVSDFSPAGDQPEAIDGIISSIQAEEQYRTLLGVTGSGKTFTLQGLPGTVRSPRRDGP